MDDLYDQLELQAPRHERRGHHTKAKGLTKSKSSHRYFPNEKLTPSQSYRGQQGC